jgi:hypothetical protein
MPPPSTLLRAVLVWLLFIVAESAQGALRRVVFGPVADLAVRQVSVAIGAVVVFLIAWLFRRWLALRSAGAALAVGVLWVALTVVFELALQGLLGRSWTALAADYDIARGGLMPLGLLAMALAPWVVRGPSLR